MGKLYKYAFLNNRNLRLVSLGIIVFGNIALALIAKMGYAAEVVATVFSSLILTFAVVCVVVDTISIEKALFKSPSAYITHLTPQPAWKKLLSYSSVTWLYGIVIFVLALLGLLWQSFTLSNYSPDMSMLYGNAGEVILPALAIVLGVIYICVFAYYWEALNASLFSSKKGGKLLAVLVAIASVYVLSQLNWVFLAFGSFEFQGIFVFVNLNLGINAGTIVYFGLLVVKSVALFIATAHLLERRINL